MPRFRSRTTTATRANACAAISPAAIASERLAIEGCNPPLDVERIQVSGIEAILGATRKQVSARAEARWSDCTWSVVFRRPMAGAD